MSNLSDNTVLVAAKRTEGLVPDAGGNGAFNVKTDSVIQGIEVDQGSTITVGGTSQTLAAANPNRRGFTFQNQSSGDLRLNALNTATLDFHSLLVVAGQYFESSVAFIGTGAISVIGATTGQAFYAREF